MNAELKIPLIQLLILAGCAIAPAQESLLTPQSLRQALLAKPAGAAAENLAAQIRARFGSENLLKGANVLVDETTAAWAIETAGSTPIIVSEDGRWQRAMERIGSTQVYAFVETLAPNTIMRWHYRVGDQRMGGGPLEVYAAHPDSKPQPGVPQGRLVEHLKWESRIFPGTTRDWWVYLPAQYRPEAPAAVMVFQDGQNARNYVPVVFDNLIARGELPVTVVIFIAPGTRADGRSNRSFEYDTLSNQYARFLLEEILPEVERTVKLKQDAASRAIGGISSGAICAFTVAWERPDAFSKVLSWVGSYVNIASGPTLREGGHNYPALIRKTPPKPIHVFLQGGANDLDNQHGNWPLANQEMARALAFAKYDYQFVYGQGFHSDRHGRAILPDSLRWLWRDYPKK